MVHSCSNIILQMYLMVYCDIVLDVNILLLTYFRPDITALIGRKTPTYLLFLILQLSSDSDIII